MNRKVMVTAIVLSLATILLVALVATTLADSTVGEEKPILPYNPGKLVATSSEVAVNSTYSWVSFPINLSITNGLAYWFAWFSDSEVYTMYDVGTKSQWQAVSGVEYPNVKQTIAPTYDSDFQASIYAVNNAGSRVLGYSDVGSIEDRMAVGWASLNRHVADNSANVTAIRFYCHTNSEAGKVKVMVYSSLDIVTSTGQHGEVILQLPTGVPSHPTCLRFVATDHDDMSEYGAGDELTVALWIPQYNGFMPVAIISDNTNPGVYTFVKSVYNNTFVWNTIMHNVFNVTDNSLNVWGQNGVITANLTIPINITLPLNLMVNTTYATWGNLSFTLPPMTLTFHSIGDSFVFEESVALLPHPPLSGYTYKVDSMQSPAWVTAEIPTWIRTAWLETSGHICTQVKMVATPPAT